jgi:hypothetical protein
MAIDRYEGALSSEKARAMLRQRDRNLRLEMDSFNQLGVFCEELAEEFPEARFVLTLREPRAWLNSIVNQHLRVDVSERPLERRMRELFFGGDGCEYEREEEELERAGLFPISGYLKGWTGHYRRALSSIPPDRLLVIRTEDLGGSVRAVAGFLSIPEASIDVDKSHLHKTRHDHGVLSKVDQELVNDKIQEHCSDVWGELDSLACSRIAAGNNPTPGTNV